MQPLFQRSSESAASKTLTHFQITRGGTMEGGRGTMEGGRGASILPVALLILLVVEPVSTEVRRGYCCRSTLRAYFGILRIILFSF